MSAKKRAKTKRKSVRARGAVSPRASETVSAASEAPRPTSFENRAKKVLRRLLGPDSFLRLVSARRYGVFTSARAKQAVMETDATTFFYCLKRDLIGLAFRGESCDRYVLTLAGAAWYRRITGCASGSEDSSVAAGADGGAGARGSDIFRRQHQDRETRLRETDEGVRSVEVNFAESPLAWLARRRDSKGCPYLSAWHYEAGERLRSDFTRAGMTPRMTVNWSLMLQGGSRSGRRDAGEDAHIATMTARQRFREALDYLGSDLSEIAVQVCCHLRSLRSAEALLGLPQRSGKIVLRIALERLSGHYALASRRSSSRARD